MFMTGDAFSCTCWYRFATYHHYTIIIWQISSIYSWFVEYFCPRGSWCSGWPIFHISKSWKKFKKALFNKVVQFFNASSVWLFEEEGKKLVTCLRNILWYLDGHHHMFERINKPISPSFSSFIGYNVPELWSIKKELQKIYHLISYMNFHLIF